MSELRASGSERKRFRAWVGGASAIVALTCGLAGCRGVQPSREAGAAEPPAGLAPDQVPQFVVFGSDDNGYAGLEGSGAEGGLHFLTTLFADRRNPAGSGNAGTFDGAAAHYSFYVNTHYITGEATAAYGTVVWDDPVWVKRAWKEAIDAGHEIGVHSHSHPHGRDLTAAQWEDEITRCIEVLGRPYDERETPGSPNPASGLGVARRELPGFRTPYLEYSDRTLTAVRNQGFAYDCSLEEGTQDDQDGRNFVWPYRLDQGSPANPEIGSHAGLWEIPVYVFVVPPDGECERFGVPPGLRAELKKRKDYFDVEAGKVTGMDWNLWCEFSMTPAEFLATVNYTLELRLQGNRCPLTIGLHSELYSDRQDTGEYRATVAERRAALTRLVAGVLERDEVRVVSSRELLDWLRRPVPLR
jgi:peptidoglycan/xylan/chitin deacetylase (PgdA/CDA1 family)